MTEKAARGVGWSQDKQHRENQIVLDKQLEDADLDRKRRAII